MHRPEHFLSFSNVDRVEKPDAARDNVEERDDAFNWGVCLKEMWEGRIGWCAPGWLVGGLLLRQISFSSPFSEIRCFVYPLGKRLVVLGGQGPCDGTQ